MSDSESFRSAKISSRAAIWSALIGSTGVIVAAWIGLGVGRNQSEDKITELRRELGQRNAEVEALRGDLQAQKEALDQIRKELEMARPRGGTSASNPVPDEASRPEPGPERGAQVDTGEGITFALNWCRRNGNRVKCDLTVTSNEDKEMMLFGNSRLIEANGTEVFVSKVALGNEEVGGRLSGVARDLIRNVPIKAGISFDGIDPNAKTVSLIELRCSPANARFRGVVL